MFYIVQSTNSKGVQFQQTLPSPEVTLTVLGAIESVKRAGHSNVKLLDSEGRPIRLAA